MWKFLRRSQRLLRRGPLLSVRANPCPYRRLGEHRQRRSRRHFLIHKRLSQIDLMFALGHKRTFRRVESMSALPPKADIGTRSWNVRFVPIADIMSCRGRAAQPRRLGGGVIEPRAFRAAAPAERSLTSRIVSKMLCLKLLCS